MNNRDTNPPDTTARFFVIQEATGCGKSCLYTAHARKTITDFFAPMGGVRLRWIGAGEVAAAHYEEVWNFHDQPKGCPI